MGEAVGVSTALGDAVGAGEGEAVWALATFAPATIDNEIRMTRIELAFRFILSSNKNANICLGILLILCCSMGNEAVRRPCRSVG